MVNLEASCTLAIFTQFFSFPLLIFLICISIPSFLQQRQKRFFDPNITELWSMGEGRAMVVEESHFARTTSWVLPVFNTQIDARK